jgi:hypothetical protein
MERREVLGAGALGLTALVGPAEPAVAAQREDMETARAIDRLRDLLDQRLDNSFADLRQIRQAQRTFLKANYKFPDFLEIGPGVWDRVYDWHLRHHQQAPTIDRRADGRYTMVFTMTTLIMRPELDDNYVGFGFDNR